ncbi:uncharacterized protein LOC105434855 [Cucumis sativus]|uniref:uncharacterized protein LOC105434855 n=1 Tax=Cucumis sativus TaxID=3659 RepID=UPI0012F4FEA1|nr:uncharacterized protein LOC105434855 [Cucumis sativus]KGN64262.2 hypothetical protein Csa_014225 [Cucumis sativus]
MSLQLKPIHHHLHHYGGRHCHNNEPYQPSYIENIQVPSGCMLNHSFVSLLPSCHLLNGKRGISARSLGLFNDWRRRRNRGSDRIGHRSIVASSIAGTPVSDGSKPEKGFVSPPLSDILWPSAGAFAAMALLGKMDQILAPKGLSMTIAPLGAVCAVLFATPSAPAARKYNIFLAQIGCAAIGVLAFTLLGPGWLARSSALAASMAFMIYTGSTHPPAASLPILFIDGAKMQQLNFWYALFPGAAGCILLCLIQELVVLLKEKIKF